MVHEYVTCFVVAILDKKASLLRHPPNSLAPYHEPSGISTHSAYFTCHAPSPLPPPPVRRYYRFWPYQHVDAGHRHISRPASLYVMSPHLALEGFSMTRPLRFLSIGCHHIPVTSASFARHPDAVTLLTLLVASLRLAPRHLISTFPVLFPRCYRHTTEEVAIINGALLILSAVALTGIAARVASTSDT